LPRSVFSTSCFAECDLKIIAQLARMLSQFRQPRSMKPGSGHANEIPPDLALLVELHGYKSLKTTSCMLKAVSEMRPSR
jgi:hypothetical protein